MNQRACLHEVRFQRSFQSNKLTNQLLLIEASVNSLLYCSLFEFIIDYYAEKVISEESIY